MYISARAFTIAAILLSAPMAFAETNNVGKAPTAGDAGAVALGAPNEAGAPGRDGMGTNGAINNRKMEQGAQGDQGFVGTGSSAPGAK